MRLGSGDFFQRVLVAARVSFAAFAVCGIFCLFSHGVETASAEPIALEAGPAKTQTPIVRQVLWVECFGNGLSVIQIWTGSGWARVISSIPFDAIRNHRDWEDPKAGYGAWCLRFCGDWENYRKWEALPSEMALKNELAAASGKGQEASQWRGPRPGEFPVLAKHDKPLRPEDAAFLDWVHGYFDAHRAELLADPPPPEGGMMALMGMEGAPEFDEAAYNAGAPSSGTAAVTSRSLPTSPMTRASPPTISMCSTAPFTCAPERFLLLNPAPSSAPKAPPPPAFPGSRPPTPER